MQTRNFSVRMLALLLALVLTQPLAFITQAQAEASGVPQLPDPGKTGMTREQQQQLGLQAVGEVYKQMLYKKGQFAAPGERIAITAVQVKADRIILDLNGGPHVKHRFLRHIELVSRRLRITGQFGKRQERGKWRHSGFIAGMGRKLKSSGFVICRQTRSL